MRYFTTILFSIVFVFIYTVDAINYTNPDQIAYKSVDEYSFLISVQNIHSGIININLEEIFKVGFRLYGWFYFFLIYIGHAIGVILNNPELTVIFGRLLSYLPIVPLCVYLIKSSKLFTSSAILLLIFLSVPEGMYYISSVIHPDVLSASLLATSFICFHDDRHISANLLLALSVSIKFTTIFFAPFFLLYYAIYKRIHFFYLLLAIVILYLLLNPYIFHPRGFNAWFTYFIETLVSTTSSGTTVYEKVVILTLRFNLLPTLIFSLFPFIFKVRLNIKDIIIILSLSAYATYIIFISNRFFEGYWVHLYLPLILYWIYIFKNNNSTLLRVSINLITIFTVIIHLNTITDRLGYTLHNLSNENKVVYVENCGCYSDIQNY